MADQWTENIPTLAGQISTEYPQIEQNFGFFQQILLMLVGWSDDTLTDIPPPNIDQRPLYTYTDTDTVTISPGVYFHDGTTRQCVFWDADIAFDFGSGGSNSGSTDLGASQWHYLYLDDSAIVTQGSPELDADCFLNSTTAPTWSDAKHAYYNGSDRCIFAVPTNGSSQLYEFFHDGARLFMYADQITSRSPASIGTTWTDVTLNAPGFVRRVITTYYYYWTSAATAGNLFWRTNGQSGTTGHRITNVIGNVYYSKAFNTCDVVCDSSQKIEIKSDAASNQNAGVYTDGWYLPEGM